MTRKMAVVLSKVFFSVSPMLQALGALSVILAGMILNIQFHPMIDPRSNAVETTLLACCSAVLLAGILLPDNIETFSGVRRQGVVIFVLIVIVFASCVLAGALLVEIYHLFQGGFRRKKSKKGLHSNFAVGLRTMIRPERFEDVFVWGKDPDVDDNEKKEFAVVLGALGAFVDARAATADEDTLVSLWHPGILKEPAIVGVQAAHAFGPLLARAGSGWCNPPSLHHVCDFFVHRDTAPEMRQMLVQSFAYFADYQRPIATMSFNRRLLQQPRKRVVQKSQFVRTVEDLSPGGVELASHVFLTMFGPTLRGETRTPLNFVVEAIIAPDGDEWKKSMLQTKRFTELAGDEGTTLGEEERDALALALHGSRRGLWNHEEEQEEGEEDSPSHQTPPPPLSQLRRKSVVETLIDDVVSVFTTDDGDEE